MNRFLFIFRATKLCLMFPFINCFQQHKYNTGAKPFLPNESNMTHTRLPDTATSTPIQVGTGPSRQQKCSPYVNGKVNLCTNLSFSVRTCTTPFWPFITDHQGR